MDDHKGSQGESRSKKSTGGSVYVHPLGSREDTLSIPLSQSDNAAPPRLSAMGMRYQSMAAAAGPNSSSLALHHNPHVVPAPTMGAPTARSRAAAGSSGSELYREEIGDDLAEKEQERLFGDGTVQPLCLATMTMQDREYSSSQYFEPHPSALFPKIIHDRVHDQISLAPLLCDIMDTVEFQRLRGLHQLGCSRYLFPGATHTRFEHSLGVSHLATHLAKLLKDNHETVGPALDMTQQDMLCIGVAALCHDLGHGPFSHLFEHFVARSRREREGGDVKKWSHEEASIALLDHLLKANNIDLGAYGLDPVIDLNFIKKLIDGLKPTAPWPDDIGRSPHKRYLFDIVANKRNGIDVDKLDYFLRDSMSCYGKLPDIHIDRIFKCARVIECDGQTQICFQEKVALSLGDLFSLRAKLHKYVYQHRVVKSLDTMVEDALIAAEEGYKFTLSTGEQISLSQSVEHMEVYAKLGDWIIDAIFNTSDNRLKRARDIIARIRRRQLYGLVGHYVVPRNTVDENATATLKTVTPGAVVSPKEEQKQQPPPSTTVGDTVVAAGGGVGGKEPGEEEETIFSSPVQHRYPPRPRQSRLTEDLLLSFVPPEIRPKKETVFITQSHIVYGSSGSKPGDPVDHVRFFNPKQDPNKAFSLNSRRFSPLFSPTEYVEVTDLVFTRNPRYHDILSDAFKEWKEHQLMQGTATQDPVPCINSSPSSNLQLGTRKRPRCDEPPAFDL